MAIARFSAQILRWAVTLLVIRILSPADFGIAALAETVIGFLELFATMGLGAAIIRHREVTALQLRSIFSLIVIVNSILFLGLFFSASFIAEFYQQPELKLVMQVLSFGFVMSAIQIIPATLLAKEMKFKQLALVHLLAGGVGAVTSLVLALDGFGYWTIVLAGMSMQATRTLAVLAIRPVLLLPSFKLAAAIKFATFSGYVTGANIVWYLYVTLDIVIAGRYWSAERLGIYAVALQLAAMPLNKIMPAMKEVALPAYAKTEVDPGKSRYYLVKSLRLSMGIGLPIFFGLASISMILVPLIFDLKWADAAMPLTLLFMAMPFRMFLELHQPAIIAAGKPALIFRNSLCILVFMVIAFFFAVQFGPGELATVWLLLFAPLAMVASYTYCRSLEINYRKVLAAITPAFIASMSMFGIVRGFNSLMRDIGSDWLNLMLAILVGAVFYLGAIALLDRKMLHEYLDLFRR